MQSTRYLKRLVVDNKRNMHLKKKKIMRPKKKNAGEIIHISFINRDLFQCELVF